MPSSCRPFWSDAIRRGLLVAVMLLMGCGGSLLLGQPGGTEAGLSIVRIYVPPERAAKELEKVQQGALVLVPLPEFESRVERARKALQAREQQPRLARAQYSAELFDESFRSYLGRWTILNAGEATAVLPIVPINLALRNPKWEQGAEAILAEFDGKALGLAVKPGPIQTCFFDWSVRGTRTNEGTAFKLAVPPCPINTFEFKLPADAWLTVLENAGLVTGPHDADSANKRLWKVQITGSKPIEMLVRRIAEPKGPAPTLFARVQSDQQLALDRIEVTHDFQVDILHGSVRRLILEGDGGLQPYDVALKSGEVKTWKWTETDPGTDPKGKSAGAATGQLTIDFHQPVQGRLQGLHVRSLASRPLTGSWTSPALRVQGALPRGETLNVKLPPDLPLGRWDHGTFQPTKIATEADGTQLLTLAETAQNVVSSRRPTFSAPPQSVDLQTSENYQWDITPRGATLAAEIQFALVRGSLFELRVKLPKTFPGYQIETIEMRPPSLLRDWRLDGASLVIELTQALMPTNKAALKLQLHAGFRELTAGIRTLAYPELEPLGIARRRGAVAIHVDPFFQAQLLSSSIPLAAPQESGPEKQPTPASFRFDFRDKSVSALIRLIPQPVQVQLHGKHRITLAEDNARLQFHWEVEPLVGAPEHLDFRLAPGFPSAWRVLGEEGVRIHHWERLHLHESLPHLLHLGCKTAWQAAALNALTPTGTYWRFHLAEPLRKKAKFTLEAAVPGGWVEDDWRRQSLQMPGAAPWERLAAALALGALPKSAGDRIWPLPLMTPVQRANVDGHVVIESQRGPITKVTADSSLRPKPSASQSENDPIHLRMHPGGAGPIDPGTRVTVRTRPEKRSISLLELCDEAKLTSFIHRDGRVYHRLQFRLWHLDDRTFDLRFPVGTQILAARLHDRWLANVAAEEMPAHVRLTLPFDQNAEFVRYEIVARSEARGSFLPGMMRIETPHIDWPVAPIDLQTRWFLEAGLTPLHQETLTPAGVPARIANETATPRALREAWEWGQTWWSARGAFATPLARKLDEQKQTVLLAEKSLRDDLIKPAKLADALERLALQQLKDGVPLLIDRVAFRLLGLSSETALSPATLSPQAARPFWESLGLVYLPCSRGALLTSLPHLQSLGINSPAEAPELDDALQEAILHGQDSSSGFCLILTWLRLPPDDAQEFSQTSAVPGASSVGDPPLMTEWQIVPVAGGTKTFLVVDPFPARVLGWLLALLMALALWRLGRILEPRSSLRAYILLLAVGILIAVWLPMQVREFFGWPMVLVLAAGFLWHLVRFVSRRGEPVVAREDFTVSYAAGSVTLSVCFLALTWEAPAQPSAVPTHTVLIIDGPKPAALVAPSLLAKLDELENQPELGTQNVVLVSAKYVGKIQDGQARIDVQYEFHSFKDKATLVIPLTGVQLQEGVFLDGAPVYPVPHKQGYALPIRDKGVHHLRLSFTVRAVLAGGRLDLAFKIPKLIQNEMTLQGLAPAQIIECLTCTGEEKLSTTAPPASKEWRCQLGYVDSVHLRWTDTATQPVVKSPEVKEAHFWDLRPASLALHSSFQYTIGKDSLTQLSVAMPEGLHVRSVEALATPPQPPVGKGGHASVIVLKQWSIVGKGGQRRLAVDFVQPVTGTVTLNLEIVPPAFAQKPTMLLPLPAPLQGKFGAGVVGYHLDALATPAAQNLVGVQSISAEEFDQQWKKRAAAVIPPASRTFSFQRQALQAGLELKIEPASRHARLQLAWHVDRHFAELRGKFTIVSAHENLILLEFQVEPGLTLADIAGPDVQRWQLQGALLQVWLRQPRQQTTIEMTGWRLPLAKTTPATLLLPGIYPIERRLVDSALKEYPTRLVDSALKVHAAADIQLQMEKLKSLRADPADSLRFAIESAPYETTVRLTPRMLAPQASMLTKLQPSEGGIEIWQRIRLTSERGRMPTLKLLVKDWPFDPMVLSAPGANVQATPGKESAWTLTYPAGMPHESYILLRGRIAKDANVAANLPSVELAGANVSEHLLAWQDLQVQQLTNGKNVVPQAPAKPLPRGTTSGRWFEDRAAWKFADRPTGPITAKLPKSSARTNGRILASAEETRLAGQPPWLREASFWVHAPERTELRIKFPAPAESFSALVGERLHSAWTPAAKEFVLALDGSSEPRLVRLRWKHSAITDRLAAPTVAGLQIDQTPLLAHQRVLWIPAGMRAELSELETVPTLVPRLLQEADSQAEITAALALESPRTAETAKRIASRQQQFHASLRHAEYALAILEVEPAAWHERVAELKRKNEALANERQYDDVRKSAQKQKQFVPLVRSESGTASAGTLLIVPPGLTRVPLQFTAERTYLERRTFSEMMVLAAIFLLVFSYFRHGRLIARAAAPEAAIAMLVVAMLIYGISVIGMALGTVLLGVRCCWLANAWRQRRALSVAATSPASQS